MSLIVEIIRRHVGRVGAHLLSTTNHQASPATTKKHTGDFPVLYLVNCARVKTYEAISGACLLGTCRSNEKISGIRKVGYARANANDPGEEPAPGSHACMNPPRRPPAPAEKHSDLRGLEV